MRKYSFDFSRLKGRIIERHGSLSGFADVLGKPVSHVSRCLRGEIEFNQPRVMEWCEVLEIPCDEIAYFFYVLKVDR